jgi:hypothetical protein
MGQVGSRVFNTLTRDIRNFNIENRAHKIISKEKPNPAPHYPADAKELDRVARGIHFYPQYKTWFICQHYISCM